MVRRVRHRLQRLPPADRLAWAVVLIGAAGAAALIALSERGDGAPAGQGRPAASSSGEPDPGIRRCADIDVPRAPREAVTCRARSATLTIVRQAKPLLLGGTQARVIDTRRSRGGVIVRLRLRNETGSPQRAGARGQQIYLNIRGLRVDASPRPRARIAAGNGETLRLRFPLSASRARLLQRAGNRADLGIVPWNADAGTDVRGVIRLTVGS